MLFHKCSITLWGYMNWQSLQPGASSCLNLHALLELKPIWHIPEVAVIVVHFIAPQGSDKIVTLVFPPQPA